MDLESAIKFLLENLQDLGQLLFTFASYILGVAKEKIRQIDTESVKEMIGELDMESAKEIVLSGTKKAWLLSSSLAESLHDLGQILFTFGSSMLGVAKEKIEDEGAKNCVLEKLKELWLLLSTFATYVIHVFNEKFPPETRDEKIHELLIKMDPESAKNFVLEKLKELWLLLSTFATHVLNVFNEKFPPETRDEKFHELLPWLITGSVVLVLSFCCCKRGIRGGGGRTMRAPGRSGRMLRSQFESSPKSYFRGLRGQSSSASYQLLD